MKITSVRALPVATPLDEPLRWGAMSVGVKGGVLVIVTTDEGIVGYGEAGFSAEYFPTVGPVINDQLGPLLVGRDPLDIGAIWQEMFESTHMWGRRGIETYAVSGIDIALWDILGKVAGQPVYRLLGANKSTARAYFAPSLKETALVVAEAAAAKHEGFSAIKLRLGKDVAEARALVSGVREAVGEDFDIMVDANMAYDRRTALHVARMLEEYNVEWLEEPIMSRSLSQYVEDHAWLAERVSLKLAGGESLFTRFEYLELLERKVFDVLQPDCTSVGGISEAKRVADMASAWNIECVPHIACSSGTGIGLAAGLHVILACANTPLIEFDAYRGIGWEGFLTQPLEVADGHVAALDLPGIGIELLPDALERFSLDPRSVATV